MTQRFTIEEAAARLHKKPRWLQEWLRENPTDRYGQPYYTPIGRGMILTHHDVARIENMLEEKALRETFVYFVEMAGHIKIGRADNWKKRLSGIRTSTPLPVKRLLVIRTGEGLEAMLHARFAKFRVRREWFVDCSEIREFMAKAADSPLKVAGEEDAPR